MYLSPVTQESLTIAVTVNSTSVHAGFLSARQQHTNGRAFARFTPTVMPTALISVKYF